MPCDAVVMANCMPKHIACSMMAMLHLDDLVCVRLACLVHVFHYALGFLPSEMAL